MAIAFALQPRWTLAAFLELRADMGEELGLLGDLIPQPDAPELALTQGEWLAMEKDFEAHAVKTARRPMQ